MPDQWGNRAADRVAALLAERSLLPEQLDAATAWDLFADHATGWFDEGADADRPGGEGLLHEVGTYSFTGRPLFTLGLVHQLELLADDGEHACFVHVRLEVGYEPDPELVEVGSAHSWWFPGDTPLRQWLGAVRGRPEWALLERRTPAHAGLQLADQ